jgi:cytochrome c553
MKKLALAVVLGALSITANAADIAAGKTKSAMCVACHGAKGISPIPMYPNLAGQNAEYTIKQLKAFKSGARKDAVMASMSAGLSDQDIENLAAYYASLKAN